MKSGSGGERKTMVIVMEKDDSENGGSNMVAMNEIIGNNSDGNNMVTMNETIENDSDVTGGGDKGEARNGVIRDGIEEL